MKGKGPKRATNAKKKETRKRSWLRGQERKEQRRQAQRERETRNQKLREQGLPTPWEAAKARRIDK